MVRNLQQAACLRNVFFLQRLVYSPLIVREKMVHGMLGWPMAGANSS
jgi:hypothetical protein